ncbi:tyrosine-protein phosphatase [Phenylobacterium sp.]|uniref:tyrosine-protein phosphatase n=1 Tax=Phenylobacterium sp. TaxID=1871053 RepID=UPI0025E8DC9C|nr:tyrosine-protein phosphatase [Phenylobacterium sp.]MBX3482670.1 tyrosine-protein phosphatase [Phenylobacterium sp.]MCW5760826.1 tyrosine-protein phosphatase [Phenylobacterium sp.]
MSRRIAFEGIDNFRDFGDYAAGPRRLKSGLLYRSAGHGGATDADLEKLAAMNLAVIVDLRRANERERQPSRRWSGFAAQVIDNDIGQEAADEWLTFIQGSDLAAKSFHDYMMEYYRKAPLQQRHLDLYTRYFRALADTEGAILVHCAAGKDRTGIACALTHHLAGVHDDDIVEDYLLTNDAERLEKRLPTIREVIRESTGRVATDDALMVAMRVEPEYLEESFRVMRETYGSLDGYLGQALGLGADTRARIHDRLLA